MENATKNYGVLKGRPIDSRLGFGRSPHYQVQLVDEDDDYRIAINVKSKQHPSALLYLIDEQFSHPMLDGMSLAPGEVLTVNLAGDTIQLGNKGGIISLLNQEGLNGVKYTREDTRAQGRTIVF